MKKVVAMTLIIVLFALLSGANGQNTSLFESVMKVRASGGAYGTATFINEDEEYYYALTNYHVTGGKNPDIQCFREGHASIYMQAKVIWNAYTPNEPKDISLLAIKKSQLNWKPTIISFLEDDIIYKSGDTIVTIGCPGANWPEAFKGHINKVQGGKYYFTPVALPGRSGSVLFNHDATKAIGLIAWYDPDTDQGIAMTAETIQNAVNGKRTGYYFDQPYNFKSTELRSAPDPLLRWARCGPQGCPPDQNEEYEQYDQQDDQNQPRNDGRDQFKIFPTYPGEDGDEFEPKPTEPSVPEAPKIDLLEEYKKKNDAEMAQLDLRLKDVEKEQKVYGETLNAVDGNVKELTQGQKNLKDTIDKLSTDTKDHGSIPGKLDIFKKEIDADLKNQKELIGKELNKVQEDFIKLIKENKNSTEKYVTEVKETITNNNTVDRQYGLAESAVQVGIPSLVAWLIAYLYRRHIGGAAPKNPFQMKKTK